MDRAASSYQTNGGHTRYTKGTGAASLAGKHTSTHDQARTFAPLGGKKPMLLGKRTPLCFHSSCLTGMLSKVRSILYPVGLWLLGKVRQCELERNLEPQCLASTQTLTGPKAANVCNYMQIAAQARQGFLVVEHHLFQCKEAAYACCK